MVRTIGPLLSPDVAVDMSSTAHCVSHEPATDLPHGTCLPNHARSFVMDEDDDDAIMVSSK